MRDAEGTSARDLAVGLPAAALAGLLVGVLGTFKHQVGVSAATGAGFPLGLLLSLAMVGAFLAALRLAFPARWFAAAAGVGVVAAVVVLSLPSPNGSSVILAGPAGVTWTIGPAILAAAIVGWPRISRRTAADPGDPAPDGILGR